VAVRMGETLSRVVARSHSPAVYCVLLVPSSQPKQNLTRTMRVFEPDRLLLRIMDRRRIAHPPICNLWAGANTENERPFPRRPADDVRPDNPCR